MRSECELAKTGCHRWTSSPAFVVGFIGRVACTAGGRRPFVSASSLARLAMAGCVVPCVWLKEHRV